MIRVIVVALAVAAVLAADVKYSTKWDDIDLDQILANDRLLKNYIDCLLAASDERCTPDGKALKNILPDALATGCEKCSEKQKTGSRKAIKHLHDNKPEEWEKLLAKYDPSGEYRTKYAERFGS